MGGEAGPAEAARRGGGEPALLAAAAAYAAANDALEARTRAGGARTELQAAIEARTSALLSLAAAASAAYGEAAKPPPLADAELYALATARSFAEAADAWEAARRGDADRMAEADEDGGGDPRAASKRLHAANAALARAARRAYGKGGAG